jgi:hypothetical protein
MAKGDPQQSPWNYTARDNDQRVCSVTLTFNNNTRSITGGTMQRDPGCRYAQIYPGVGPDGQPDSSPKKFPDIPVGTNPIPLSEISKRGFTVIEDILAGQITAGP